MNQSCINVRMIPNFKFLADHHKVSEDTLKEIIYKYRIETNNEDAVPTEVYIQAQLGKMQYVDSNPSAKKLWDRDYKTSKEFASVDKFKEAKKEAETYFPAKAIKGYTNEKDHWVLSVMEPVKEIVPKKRANFPSWQEYNDYLLVYGEVIPAKAREKEQQVIGNQPFTFKDGTTVTVPFRPNSQQEEALNTMNDFLKSKETSMTLSGYAGTGKTSLMEIIAKKAKKEGRLIVFSASTNKAAAVLRDRVKSAGFTANTLNKVFGIQVEVDSRKPYDATNLVNKLKDAEITPGTVVVIDEASMINEENFKILNGIAQENGLKIIYVGDKGQLAPVNESQVSKVFRNQNGRIVSLTKVERTDDNAILEEATNLRNGQALSGESSFNKEGKGVAFVKKSNRDSIKKIVERFVPQLKQNPDYFRILAYTNAAVAKYNEAVRRTLGYTDNTPRINEPIVGYDNWGYVWDKNGGTYRFINSEAYKVTKVGKPTEIYKFIEGSKIKLQATPVTIQDSMGKTQEIDFIDIKGNPENRKAALALAKEKVRLWNQAMALPKGSKVRTSLLAQKGEIEEFLFVNDNIVEGGKTLQKKVFDFGYAMTVHKSQGSTFTHVMVDDADIATARNKQDFGGEVVGLTFDDETAYEGSDNYTTGEQTDIALDWDSPSTPTLIQTPTPSTTDNNSINIRQQLEYVAVSRATDTVTVIANDANVKKEDTPLNHIKEQNPTLPSAKSNLTDSKSQLSEEVESLYEDNQVEETNEGIKIPLAKGVSIKMPDSLGGMTFTIDIFLDESYDVPIRTKTYDREGKYSHTTDLPHDYFKGIKGIKVFSPSGEDITNVYRNSINQENSRSNKEGQFISATIAPYFNTSYGDYVNMSAEEQKEMREAFGAAAKKVAGLLGINLDMKKASFNIGGYEFTETTPDGKDSIVEPSFTFRLDTTPEKARLFAALMGDLGFQQQEAVVSNYDVTTAKEADGIRFSIPFNNSETLLKLIDQFEIKNFTYDKTKGVLSVLSFDTADVEKFHKLVNKLKEDGYETESETFYFKSSYDGRTGRKALYGKWLKAQEGQARGNQSELYNVVQEALEKVQYYSGTPSNYEGLITPEEDTIFVFGSNPEGRHGAGAAKTAKEKFGAIYGQGEGLQGNAYALPTKDLRVKENKGLRSISPEQITENIRRMYNVAEENPDKLFKVAYTHGLEETSLNGYTGAEMIKMFKDAGPIPANVIFSKNWTDHWNEVKASNSSQVEDTTLNQTEVSEGIKVKLPGYEYFNDLYEDTTVDAEWKVPILQDLDSRLSTENTEQENDNILNQMTRVMQATSEEEYTQAPTKERQEVNDKMSDYWRRNNQMNALMDNEVGLAASEVREVAEDIVNSISDIITEIQADPEKVKEFFPTLNITKDLSTATRKEIVQAVNINNLIKETKRRFEDIRYNEDNEEAWDLYDDPMLTKQADLILENWDTIMELAADVFVVNEGFSIKRNTKKQSFETAERDFTGYDYDNFTDPQDEDSIREQEDEQEHWQVEARTIDAFNSMSDQVRLAYHNCYELDKNGNKILNKWGIPRRVNKVVAVAQTLRWTQGAMDINQMVEKLSQKEARNPWINQLIKRLTDTTGKEADFQSQFFGVMHRHFQLYSIGQLENGVYTSKTLNNHVALSEIMKGITAQFQLKGHPLFNADGSVKADSLKELKKWYEELGKIVNKYNIRFNNGKYTSNNAISDTDIETTAKSLTAASRMLGYSTTEESVKSIVNEDALHKMWSKLGFAISNLEKAGENYDPFNFETENNIRSEVMGFLTPIVEELEDAATNAFFDNGKMYQSYVIPSFLTQLFDQFKQPDETFYQWMDEFYGQSEWFKNSDGTWRLDWLEQMSRDPKAREIFDHKVQLNFNKHDYMRNMTPEEFTLSVFMEYFSERLNNKDLEHTPVWFRVPIQSNKPSSEFIKFYADRTPNYKEHIVEKMYSMFLQELSRIDTVRKRNRKEGDADFIASFDENGRKFQFLPWLNPFLEDNTSELGKLLQKKVKAEEALSEAEEARLMNLVQETTMDYMQQRADRILQNWEDTGILKAAEKVKGIKSLNHSVKENLENFLWNDFYAANSILQLTVVDKAFYRDATELQKRLSELHAPGTRGNKYATDYNGKRVSDGFYRTMILKDFDKFIANIIDNISVVFDKKIAAAKPEEKPGLIALKESLVGENGAYRRINVTDAQAYSSPSSYRKKAFMFGKWSHKAEEIYQRLLKGDYTVTDLEVAFQPLKPFVYGHLSKGMGVDAAPITKMPVPFQAKNAEYLLVMADALTRGEDTGRPNLLRAIFNIMEKSERQHPTQGIDTIQFESAIKSGGQGIIDLAQFLTMPGGEAGAYTLMKSLMFQDSPADDGTNYNYSAYVHKTNYDNYALQQEVPAHFREHAQAEGSQQRMNIPTDLDFYNYDGEVNNYSWKDPDGIEHKMNAREFRQEYERVHATNIEDSFNQLVKELHLDSSDKKARNLALSEILQDEIISSPRYGIDLFIACQIDPATGEFRIPKGDPIQGKRIEQLVNSIIKNRVNKQKVSGGPIVQVTNFGTSKQLHIRFHDKNGGILMTKEEYENSVKEQPTSQTDKFNAKYGKKTGSTSKSYEQYLKENQAGIAHFEIFAPIGMKKVFEKFKNPDGTINLEAVEKCDPELLKVITARIPNEDKYSIAHGKIVGFMPALAGDAIMFPYELTEIDDSDFDVDKRYTMQKVIDIVTDWSKVKDGLMKAAMAGLNKAKTNNPEWYKKWAAKKNMGQSDRDVILNQVEMFMDNPEQMKDADALMKSMYQEYQRILQEEYPYKTVYPKKGTRDANNNQIIDMCWAVMSNEMTADKVLNPGGFEVPKHTAYVISAYKNTEGKMSWEQLDGMTTKELQKIAVKERDLAWFDDHVQFYKQNAAGSNLIGAFAVNKVAHATLEGDGLLINIEDFCGEKPFTIADSEFKGMVPVDDSKDSKGQLIGKNLGSGVGASADTAKDPWLDAININMTTVGMYCSLQRMKMPMEDAELFMAQDVILRMMNEFNRKSLENKGITLDKIIQDRIDTIKKKNEYTEDSTINEEPLTRDELKEGLIPLKGNISQEREAIEYKTLLAFQKLKTLAKAIRKPTLVTRLNSVSSAVGPLIIDNIILEHKLNSFLQIEDEDTTGFYHREADGTYSPVDMDDILFDHPILKEFSKPIDSRNPNCPTRIMFSDMPAGSSLFKAVLKVLPSNIDAKIYDDRQLLSKLSDFFQSYFLVANDVVKPEELKYYIEEFPKEFAGVGKSKGIKEQYPDNAFVQAIQLNYEKKSQRAFLNINTTGMKEQEKERLRMAWTDLHKTNPELSTKLFNYAFFRGGIGFSPKTFMGLVPTYVKEHLTGYVDTYRHFPRIIEDVVVEQFVRNNWNNSTLVPRKGGENTKYQIDLDNGTLIVRDENDKKDLAGVKFMKTVVDKETYLWKLLGTEDTNKRERYYIRIYPLGNNGEYMEMSTTENMDALTRTTELKDNNDITELPETSPMETDAAEVNTPTSIPESDSQQSKTLSALVSNVMHLDSTKSPEEAQKHLENYADMLKQGKLTKGHMKYLVNLLNDAGIKVALDNVLEEFKKFC